MFAKTKRMIMVMLIGGEFFKGLFWWSLFWFGFVGKIGLVFCYSQI